ncbi:hypothetical protein J1N35_028258 [Gossypium stocksii]|uniref:AAA+ ATPase domain-containing protein n=1 Tax=Gossypium stocksii TaxID=47602 RepID=A0A9D3UVJ8_9ROSI|nr:hypothetical protein J1N35_028258 [Gossypium stocksii]
MAEYVASTAVENVTNQAKEYALPYLRYFFGYGEIVEDFMNQRKALKLRKQRVKTRVDEAKRQIEVIYEDVEDWLRRAEKELEETQNLQDEIDRIKCFKWCPKWGWRYCLSKKLAEKTPIISKLLEASNFPQVGYRGSLQGIEFITSTDFMDSESSKSAFIQIMEAINAKGVNMIGLHGMPGVGKTTLAQEVGKHAREQKLFDKPRRKSRSAIQEYARREQILLIVDDLWEEFKLESIGIPFGDEHKGCKILLTTRDQQVCTKMNCQKEIQLGILSEDEAWVLFRGKAGLDDDNSTLNDVAKEVAAQCKGLPLAIVVVAKALKGESLNGWTTVNQRFKESRHLDNEKVLGGVLKPLKLSYDYLKEGNSQMTGNDIQMCFLLCSLFPEDYEISLEILIMCGIGVGLFPNAYSIEDKRNEIVMALKKLQKSGLLLRTNDAERIRMHDVVRDFAHWLTSIGENRFMVKDELKEWPDMDGCYTAIALWNCSSNIKKLPDKVEFSKLKTLILEGDWDCDWNWDLRQKRKRKRKRGDLLVVSSIIFEEMKALQVLYLESVSFSPIGFHSLPNLKTLCCVDCELENFSSSLKNMRSLEILSLIGTKIDEISEELVKLSTLKYLRLSGVGVEEEINIPPNLLKLRNVSGQKNIVPSIGKTGVNELTSLKLASCKDMEFLIDITSDQGSTIVFSNLVKLNIHNMVSLKGLCYGLSRSHRAIASLTRLKCDGVEQVIGFAQEDDIIENDCRLCCWSKLRILHIQSCKSLKYVCASTSTQGLQSLEFLQISHCPQFMQIFNIEQNGNGQDILLPGFRSQNYYWPKLKTLRIMDCPIFSCFIVQARLLEDFVCIQGLVISNVGIIWKIDVPVLNEDCIVVGNHEEVFQVQGGYSFSRIKELDLKNLFEVRIRWNDFAQVVTLQNLTTLKLRDCKKLRYIFSPITAHSLSHLVNLFIEGCEEIEQLVLAKDQVSSSSSSNGDISLQPISFPNLTNITVRNCGNLKSLFPFGYVPVLPKLECLKLKTNSKLEEVFELKDEVEVTVEKEMNFGKLEWLSLEELPGLIHFCPKGYHFVLSALRVLTVRDCPKLTTGFFIDSQESVHCKTKIQARQPGLEGQGYVLIVDALKINGYGIGIVLGQLFELLLEMLKI